jgi:hypothetical protein
MTNFIMRHRKVLRMIFRKYANSGYKVKDNNLTFEEINKKQQMISLGEILMMLK